MGRVIHFEIHCVDLDRAERFYTEVFEWRSDRSQGAPVDYRVIATGPDDDLGINGALTGRRDEIDRQAVVAYVNTVRAGELAETERRIAANGGERVVHSAQIPGVGTVAYFKDTEGNVFGALQPAS
jgi:predicted enzyme related to lactoylglutathione lyase